MDSDIRSMMVESASRLLSDLCTTEAINGAERGEWPAALWKEVEEAGLPLAAVAEEAGGAGGSIADLCAVLHRAGYFAAPIPIAETALAATLCARAGLELPAGAATLAINPLDPPALRQEGAGWRVSGSIPGVPWAGQAGSILVAGLAGKAPMLALVSPKEASIEAGANAAGEPRARVVLDGAPAISAAAAPVDVAAIWRLAALLRAAQMAGAAQRVLDIASGYAQERKQFGRAISTFQSIQQLLSELAGQVATVQAAVASAADTGEAPESPSACFAIAAAKVRAGEASGRIAAMGHQVLGAMGFTHEHNLHHFTRRLWSWRDEFGSESRWAAELGRIAGRTGADGLWPLITADGDLPSAA